MCSDSRTQKQGQKMMVTMTINQQETADFSAFLTAHNLTEWFLAKDHGAYIGATIDGAKWLKYFQGCNPDKSADFYDNARFKFGGDDFGEFFPSAAIHKTASAGGYLKLKVSPTKISLVSYKPTKFNAEGVS